MEGDAYSIRKYTANSSSGYFLHDKGYKERKSGRYLKLCGFVSRDSTIWNQVYSAAIFGNTSSVAATWIDVVVEFWP